MGKNKQLLFNTIIIGIGKFSTQIVSVLLLPIYTSILTTQEYGTYDLINTIITFLMPIITLLLEESMFRFIIDSNTIEEKRNIISQTFIYNIFSTLIFAIIIFTLGKILKINETMDLILFLISGILVGLRNAFVRGLGKIKLYATTNFFNSLINIVLNIIFIVYLRLGYKGLIYSNVIANLIITIFVFFRLNIIQYISIKSLNKSKLKEMIKYSIPLVPNSISWAIINLSDRIIISSFMGTSANRNIFNV